MNNYNIENDWRENSDDDEITEILYKNDEGVFISVVGNDYGDTAKKIIEYLEKKYELKQNRDVFYVRLRDNESIGPTTHPAKVKERINDILAAFRICVLDCNVSPKNLADLLPPEIVQSCLRISVRVNGDFADEDEDDENVNSKPHFALRLDGENGWKSLYRLLDSVVCPRLIHHSCYAKSAPPLLEDTLSLSLKQLVQYLVGNCTGGLAGAVSFFRRHNFNVQLTKYDACHILTINCNKSNRLFKPRWAREAGGRAYAVIDERVFEVKRNLQRTIETYKTNDYVDMASTLRKNKELVDCYVSQKIDGCILVVSAYPRQSKEYDVMSRIASETEGAWSSRTKDYLIVPSTLDGIWMNDRIKDYALTCLTDVFGGIKTRSANESNNRDAIWNDIVKFPFTELIQSILKGERFNTDAKSFYASHDGLKNLKYDKRFYGFGGFSKTNPQRYESILTHQDMALDETDSLTLIFEMVCPHPETEKCYYKPTTSYQKSQLYLLGMFRGERYIPHYLLKNQKYNFVLFPLHRRVFFPSEVTDMLDEFDLVLAVDISGENYCKHYFDEPVHGPITFHPEGFVLYQHCGNDVTNQFSVKHKLFVACQKLERMGYHDVGETTRTVLEKYCNYPVVFSMYPQVGKFHIIRKKFCLGWMIFFKKF